MNKNTFVERQVSKKRNLNLLVSVKYNENIKLINARRKGLKQLRCQAKLA